MRKVSLVVLCFVLILSFVGCKNSSVETGNTIEKDNTSLSKETKPTYELKGGKNIHTIAFVSDTQKYVMSGSKDNFNMIKEIIDDKDKYSIEYLVHTGDIVMNPDDENQWNIAREAMNQLNGVIPYGLLAGNHDQLLGDKPFENYSEYFGTKSYKEYGYYGDSFEDCRSHYQLITIGSTEFIFVYISDDPSKECITFANEAFAKYPDRVGVLCTHKYLEEDCELDEMGKYMLENIVKPNKNVYMVLCGHESAAGCLETKVDDNRSVLQIMADYQDAGNRGTLMYLQLDENTNTLTGISYSPITKSYEGYANSTKDQFKVKIPW